MNCNLLYECFYYILLLRPVDGILISNQGEMLFYSIIVGHLAVSIPEPFPNYNNTNPLWWHQLYRPPSTLALLVSNSSQSLCLDLRLNTLSYRNTDKNMSETRNSYRCRLWTYKCWRISQCHDSGLTPACAVGY